MSVRRALLVCFVVSALCLAGCSRASVTGQGSSGAASSEGSQSAPTTGSSGAGTTQTPPPGSIPGTTTTAAAVGTKGERVEADGWTIVVRKSKFDDSIGDIKVPKKALEIEADITNGSGSPQDVTSAAFAAVGPKGSFPAVVDPTDMKSQRVTVPPNATREFKVWVVVPSSGAYTLLFTPPGATGKLAVTLK